MYRHTLSVLLHYPVRYKYSEFALTSVMAMTDHASHTEGNQLIFGKGMDKSATSQGGMVKVLLRCCM